MSANKNSEKIISLKEAIKLTHSFQETYPNAIKSFFIDIDNIRLLLDQEHLKGIRIYKGYDIDQNKENIILIGVNNEGEDMVDGLIMEDLDPCPPYCPKNSSLIKS